MRAIKAAVNPAEVGVEVAKLKESKKDGIVLVFRNGQDKADILARECGEEGHQASKCRKKSFLQITWSSVE